MSKHVDDLQKKTEESKEQVSISSQEIIKDLSMKVDSTKRAFLRQLESTTQKKSQEVLNEMTAISIDKTRQPFGYEQLRQLNLKMYSIVGKNPDGQGCDNIPERDKNIIDIEDAKQHEARKKKFYSATDLNSKLKNRKENQ
ncbi:unnamed protein product [Rotaria sp. Silwood1]|nr:unnamed protein product [Rotaria sp. Silwood1]CAF4972823.1 unnamed protein product [Rotaria sp. Silwood1]